MKNQFIGLNMDFIGFSASFLCAIHCAAVPFILTMSSLIGLQFLANPWIEYSMIFLSFIIVSLALIHGYRKHHQKIAPMIMVIAGFLMILSGHISGHEITEAIVTPLGATVVALAHVLNWKYIKNSGKSCQIKAYTD
jgi:hypothetical protein